LIHGSDDVFDVIVPLLKRLPPSLITGNLKWLKDLKLRDWKRATFGWLWQ
jgi:hypothetical protein